MPALRTRVSIRLSMDRPLTGNFKSADLQNLHVYVCTSNSNLILKIIMEFSRSSSTTVDLQSISVAFERFRSVSDLRMRFRNHIHSL